MRVAYIVKYSNDEGGDCYSEEFSDPGDAEKKARQFNGTVMIRTEEPFNMRAYYEELQRQLEIVKSKLDKRIIVEL